MAVTVQDIDALTERITAVPVEQTEPKLRLVVYGDPGVGKTSLALSFPRPLIINTDLGLEGDALDLLRAKGGLEITPDKYADLEALYFWIRDRAEHFDTIITDSLDTVVSVLLGNIVDEGRGKGSKGTGTQSVLDFVPEQAEYLANQGQVERVLHSLRLLRKHVVLTSAVRQPDSGKRTVDVSPGIQRIVNRWASVMGELVVSVEPDSDDAEPKRLLNINPASERSVNKTRFKSLLPYVVVPEGGGYNEIMARINASRVAE